MLFERQETAESCIRTCCQHSTVIHHHDNLIFTVSLVECDRIAMMFDVRYSDICWDRVNLASSRHRSRSQPLPCCFAQDGHRTTPNDPAARRPNRRPPAGRPESLRRSPRPTRDPRRHLVGLPVSRDASGDSEPGKESLADPMSISIYSSSLDAINRRRHCAAH